MPIRIVKRIRTSVVPQNLAEVIDLLSKNSSLMPHRQRDLISACNSFARLLDTPPKDIAAGVGTLRDLLAGLHHVPGRITKKRLANIRTDLEAALRTVGLLPPRESGADFSPYWQSFLDKAAARHQEWGLARFARFCSAKKIEPFAVNADALELYKRHLSLTSLLVDPEKAVRDAAKNYNVIVRRNGLDQALLNCSRGDRYLPLPLTQYPTSLQTDIERYLTRLEKPDLFSGEGPRRPLRPTSLRNVEAHLRQVLDAARRSGYPVETFQTLGELVNVDVLKAASQWMLERNGGKPPASLANILGTLLAIARYHVNAPEKTIAAIAAAKANVIERLGGQLQVMSPKSQRRLNQFRDDATVGRIIELPGQLIKRAAKNCGSQQGLIDATVAAAIAFLLACPALRMANLSALRLNEDLTREIEGSHVSFIVHISAKKTKGRRAIDAIIRPPFSTIIEAYLRHHREITDDASNGWVFPRRTGGPRTPDHFGPLISKKIFEETGVVMHPHLFRHLSGALFLEAHPGEYESVRRLVGHAKIETTTSFYAPQSSRAAFERYSDVLDRRRGERG